MPDAPITPAGTDDSLADSGISVTEGVRQVGLLRTAEPATRDVAVPLEGAAPAKPAPVPAVVEDADLLDADDEPTGDSVADLEDEPEIDAAPKLVKLKVDGEEIEVTPEERDNGYIRQATWTKRMQAAAEERKANEAVKAEVSAAREEYAAKLIEVTKTLDTTAAKEPNWADAREQMAPAEYAALKADWDVFKDRRAAAQAELDKIQVARIKEFEAQQEVVKKAEYDLLIAAIPDLTDPAKAPALQDALIGYIKEQGYTDAQIDHTTDHRLWVMMDKARRYDALVARKRTAKPKPAATPVSKPGVVDSTKTTMSRKQQEAAAAAKNRLAETGTPEAALAVLKAMRTK